MNIYSMISTANNSHALPCTFNVVYLCQSKNIRWYNKGSSLFMEHSAFSRTSRLFLT